MRWQQKDACIKSETKLFKTTHLISETGRDAQLITSKI